MKLTSTLMGITLSIICASNGNGMFQKTAIAKFNETSTPVQKPNPELVTKLIEVGYPRVAAELGAKGIIIDVENKNEEALAAFSNLFDDFDDLNRNNPFYFKTHEQNIDMNLAKLAEIIVGFEEAAFVTNKELPSVSLETLQKADLGIPDPRLKALANIKSALLSVWTPWYQFKEAIRSDGEIKPEPKKAKRFAKTAFNRVLIVFMHAYGIEE